MKNQNNIPLINISGKDFWLYNNKMFDSQLAEQFVGFVYLIRNMNTNKKYIGKKRFKKVKYFQKNKKKKRRMIESNWKIYTGSNNVLNEDIAKQTTNLLLKKEILHLCTSLGWMSYFETLEILKRNALQRDDYYNEWCSCKIHRKHLK